MGRQDPYGNTVEKLQIRYVDSTGLKYEVNGDGTRLSQQLHGLDEVPVRRHRPQYRADLRHCKLMRRSRVDASQRRRGHAC